MNRKLISYRGKGIYISLETQNMVSSYLESFDDCTKITTLESVIELYHVYKYLSLDVFSEKITKKGEIKACIGRFFSKRKLVDLIEEYEQLTNDFKKNFIHLISEFDIITSINSDEFSKFVDDSNIDIYLILLEKKISKRYQHVIKAKLLSEPRNFEYIIDVYISKREEIYLPKNLMPQEIDTLARRYCELESSNLNYLERIYKWPSNNEIKLSNKVKVKAKKSYERQRDVLFENSGSFSYKLEVSFKPDLLNDMERDPTSSTRDVKINFNKNWLEQELDYPTILNNYIYYFGFFNLGQFTILDSPYRKDLIDLIKGTSPGDYQDTFIFNHKRNFFLLIFVAYFDFLNFNKIDLEDVFETYYKKLLAEDYNITGFCFSASNPTITYYERCKSLIPEIEGLLKQFNLFREDGEIDNELLEMDAEPISYPKIKSIFPNKYIYFNSKEIISLCNLIFDNRSSLAKQGTLNFYDRVKEGLYFRDIESYSKDDLEYLEKKGIIGVGLTGQFFFKNISIIKIFNHIWEFGYMSTLQIENIHELVEDEINNGNLKYGDTLFSEQEIDYISYILDSKRFSNGLHIRNSIVHGGLSGKKEGEYKKYYIELLIILLLYTFKINEELDYNQIYNNPQ